MSFLIAGLLIASIYIWQQDSNEIAITLPSEKQRQEMLGTINAPDISLTPL